jgi:hypothetical protein
MRLAASTGLMGNAVNGMPRFFGLKGRFYQPRPFGLG